MTPSSSDDDAEHADLPQLIAERLARRRCSSAAFTDNTTISLIEAMMPTMRKGSPISSRSDSVLRTADSSSTTMNTSSSVSSTSTIGVRGEVVEHVEQLIAGDHEEGTTRADEQHRGDADVHDVLGTSEEAFHGPVRRRCIHPADHGTPRRADGRRRRATA